MILLFSGGYDSALLCLKYLDLIDVVLHFRYNHPSKDQEFAAATAIYCELKKLKPALLFEVIDIPINAKSMSIGIGETGSRYVPNRNAVFLSMAANFAFVNGYDALMYGAAPCDQADYFDCTPAFIVSMSRALCIEIHAPLLYKEQKSISTPKDQAEFVLSLAWSCYESIGNKQCGQCNSCKQDRPLIV